MAMRVDCGLNDPEDFVNRIWLSELNKLDVGLVYDAVIIAGSVVLQMADKTQLILLGNKEDVLILGEKGV